MKFLALLLLVGIQGHAQEELFSQDDQMIEREAPVFPIEDQEDAERDPAGEGVSSDKWALKKEVSENELRVRSQLPEALVKRDSRSLQNEVYKTMFKRDMKTDQREDVLDE